VVKDSSDLLFVYPTSFAQMLKAQFSLFTSVTTIEELNVAGDVVASVTVPTFRYLIATFIDASGNQQFTFTSTNTLFGLVCLIHVHSMLQLRISALRLFLYLRCSHIHSLQRIAHSLAQE